MRIAFALALTALALAGCRQRPLASEILVIEPSAASLHIVGEFDAARKTLSAQEGEAGYVHYGPYVEFEAGPLTAEFTLDATGHEGDAVAEVDVSAATAAVPQDVRARAEVRPGKRQVVALDFDAERGAKYEFRVLANGAGRVELNRITIVRR